MTTGVPSIYLHIGAMKTGTSYLQDLMRRNHTELAAAGLYVPPKARQAVRAARDVLGHSKDARLVAAAAGMWPQVRDAMLAFDGRASILSTEFLSFADQAKAAEIVSDFGSAEVHVVITVRDAQRAIPAQWQTWVRNGSDVSWPAFVELVVSGEPNPTRRALRKAIDIPRILDHWAPAVPPERLHVVTVPSSGADPRLLWNRFADTIGVDPDACTHDPVRSNASLGQDSVHLLTRLNARLANLGGSEYTATVRKELGNRILSTRTDRESRVRTPRAIEDHGMEWNAAVREAIRKSGATVTGDLDDLPVTRSKPSQLTQETEETVSAPPASDLVDSAATAVDGLHDLIARRRRRLGRHGATDLPAKPARPDASASPARWADAPEPLEAALAEIEDLVRLAVALHNRLVEIEGPDAP